MRAEDRQDVHEAVHNAFPSLCIWRMQYSAIYNFLVANSLFQLTRAKYQWSTRTH